MSDSEPNESQTQFLLETAQVFASEGKYEQAVSVLETLECTMASWLKGKVSAGVRARGREFGVLRAKAASRATAGKGDKGALVFRSVIAICVEE